MEADYLPRSLSHFVRTYNCMRKEVRLNIVSGTSATPSSLIRIELPQGLCDLSTFRMSATLGGVTADASNSVMFPPTYMMIRRFNVVCGGVNLGATSAHFNHVALATRKASTSIALDQSELDSNHDWTTLTPAAPVVATVYGQGYRTWKYFPYTACQIGGSGVLDTNIYGKTYIEIQLESQNCMLSYLHLGGTAQSSFPFTVSDIRAFVDVLYLPNSSYDSAMRGRLNNGGVIKSVVPNVISTIQNNNSANVFNVSTGSLDKYMVAGLASTWSTAGTCNSIAYNATTGAWSPFSSFSAINTDGHLMSYPVLANDPSANGVFSLTIGSEVFPAYSLVQNAQVGSAFTNKAFGKASIYNYNKLFMGKGTSGTLANVVDQDFYLSNNFIVAYDLSLEGGASEHASQLLSGLSTQGAMSVIRLDSNNFSTSSFWLMSAICSGVLSAGAGGMVSFAQ